ncbi:MAG TPA: choice-of-anchor D domain-containing protein, partial [Thioploca sp.]|nr:choice-of-anchor D domain-containing protein [Thioploca sp.]
TDFAKSNDNCANTTVAAGDTCTIKVTFVPQTEGAKNATLSIPSNDPDTATATVTLTGNGIAAVVLVPDISVTPTSHDFGDVEVGDSLSVTVTIENTGDDNLELGQLNLADTDFAKSNDNCANTTVAAGDTCTIKVTFAPQTEGAKNATLSIPSNDPDTATATVTLTGNGVANDVVTPTPAPAPCQLYAVNDQGLNNSQFFTISLDGAFSTSKLGPLYKGCDIEAFAICPKNNKIYAASGDNVANNPDSVCSDHQGNGRKGHLYRVDGKTGELVSIGDTGFNEIEDLAFSADCKTLWAWAKGDGLITIDTTTGKGTLDTPAPKMPIEGLAYNNDNTVLYGAAQTDLWKYDPVAKTLKLACTNLPGETEALEMMPDGNLLLGTHRDKTLSLHLFNPNTCQVIIGADIPTSQFDDVEGIAWPIKACTK